MSHDQGAALKPHSNKPALIGVGVSVVILLGLVIAVGSGSSRGRNNDLYSAMALYGATTTHDQADATVDEIAKNSEVTRRQAEKLAIACVQNHIELRLCVQVSYIAVNTDRLKSRGVMP